MSDLHARNWISDDRALCGLATEAADDPITGETQPVLYAGLGQLVSCPHCRACIEHCREGYTKEFCVKSRGLIYEHARRYR